MDLLRRWRLEAFVVVLAVLETASVLASDARAKPAAAAITAVSALVLLGRRWQPLAVSVAAFAALTVGLAVMPHGTTAQFFGTLATFAIAGAVNENREAIAAWAAGAAMLAYAAWVDPLGNGAGDFLLSLAFGTTMWGAGWLVSRHRQQAAAISGLARQAEQEHHAQTRRALLEERARIARELHDVVSHGLSVVILQTLAARGALADLMGSTTNDVDRHLDAVESTTRDALGEMRRMLGLLQIDDFDPPAAPPPPGLRQVPQLLERARIAGVDVLTLRLDTDASLPPGLELSVYRVLQEALTNIVKHAPGAHAELDLAVDATQVQLTVTDQGGHSPHEAVTGAGHGLVGMRERVALYSGTLHTGPTTTGGFRVQATFPRREAQPASRLGAKQVPG